MEMHWLVAPLLGFVVTFVLPVPRTFREFGRNLVVVAGVSVVFTALAFA